METRGIEKLQRVVEHFRTNYHIDFPLSQLAILLHTGLRGGMTMHDLAETMGLSQASVSRNVKQLSKYALKNEEGDWEFKGYDLVYTSPDLYEPRRLAVHLTEKGKKLLKLLNAMIEGEEPTPAKKEAKKEQNGRS